MRSVLACVACDQDCLAVAGARSGRHILTRAVSWTTDLLLLRRTLPAVPEGGRVPAGAITGHGTWMVQGGGRGFDAGHGT